MKFNVDREQLITLTALCGSLALLIIACSGLLQPARGATECGIGIKIGYFTNHTASDLSDEILGTPGGWADQGEIGHQRENCSIHLEALEMIGKIQEVDLNGIGRAN
jgi:hypothetical protein